jgi:hypothetical protein
MTNDNGKHYARLLRPRAVFVLVLAVQLTIQAHAISVLDASEARDQASQACSALQGWPKAKCVAELIGKWAASVISVLTNWQVLAAGAALFFLFSRSAPRRIARLLKPLRPFRFFGAEFVLDEDLHKDANEAVSNYRRQAAREYDSRVDANRLDEKFEKLMEEHVRSAVKKFPSRATIHVPDFLFTESLYQLLDYYPEGGGRGRTWSQRLGIIGLAWRSGESQFHDDPSVEIEELIKTWGMTRREALSKGREKKSFAAILIKDASNTPVGVLYMDSTEANDLVDESGREAIDRLLNIACESTGLTAALVRIDQELRSRGPMIRIYQN